MCCFLSSESCILCSCVKCFGLRLQRDGLEGRPAPSANRTSLSKDESHGRSNHAWVIITGLVGAYKAYTEYKVAVVKDQAEQKAAPTKDAEAAKGEQVAQVVETGIQKYGKSEEQTALAGYQQSPQLFEPVLSKVLSDIAAREPAFAQQLQTVAQQANI